jgi:hypothetical protein
LGSARKLPQEERLHLIESVSEQDRVASHHRSCGDYAVEGELLW